MKILLYSISTRKFIFFCGISSISYILLSTINKSQKNNNGKQKSTSDNYSFESTGDSEKLNLPSKNVFVLVICNSTKVDRLVEHKKGSEVASNMERQLNQTMALIKSAVALTKEIVRFVLVVDSSEIFHIISNRVETQFPSYHKQKLVLEFKSIWYPPTLWNLRSKFRACASERLFLEKVLENYDAFVYLDTDMLFLNSPENLWKEFEKFSDKQMISLVPSIYMYNRNSIKNHYYKNFGVNSGLIMFNLTRMKNFPGGFLPAIMKLATSNSTEVSSIFDQDILSIIFGEKKNTPLIYELDCSWNFRPRLCEHCVTNGISLLHGLDSQFNSKGSIFRAIFESWKQFELGESLTDLVKHMEKKIKTSSSPSCLLTLKQEFILRNIRHIALFSI